MKNRFFALTLILAGTALHAFEDKPALTRAQRAGLAVARTTGVGAGATVGSVATFGGMCGLYGAGTNEFKSAPEIVKSAGRTFKRGLDSSYIKINQLVGKNGRDKFGKDIVVYTPIVGGGIAGGTVGYKTAGAAGTYALSKWHKVSYRAEKVSHHLNINIEQYRPLLIAADVKDKDMLRAAVLEIYNARFGKHWHERLRSFFADASNLEQLLKAKRSKLSSDEQDALRMIELGDAMAELYFGKKISSKNRVGSAVEIYHELGLL